MQTYARLHNYGRVCTTSIPQYRAADVLFSEVINPNILVFMLMHPSLFEIWSSASFQSHVHFHARALPEAEVLQFTLESFKGADSTTHAQRRIDRLLIGLTDEDLRDLMTHALRKQLPKPFFTHKKGNISIRTKKILKVSLKSLFSPYILSNETLICGRVVLELIDVPINLLQWDM